MATKFILICRKGQIIAKQIRQPPAPRATLAAWKGLCNAKATEWRARRYLFRFGGQWHLMTIGQRDPVKSFPQDARDAAEVYLLMLEARDA